MEKLYYNGTIIPMTKEGVIEKALLTKDGRIAQLGEYEILKAACPEAQEVDLQGKTLMPAFVDGHSHFLMGMQIGGMADLSACSNFDDIVDVLTAYMHKNHMENQGVILGWGYDHNFLPDEKHPDRFVLDRVSTTVPVCAMHTSGHMGCVNTVALQQGGITKDTPDIKGGTIARDENGEPTGYMEELALFQVLGMMVQRLGAMAQPSVAVSEQMYLENGITTVQEGGATKQSVQGLVGMDMAGQLHVDVVAYPLAEEDPAAIAQAFPALKKNYQGHVKLGGCKLILDGSPQGKTAWMTEPYENSGDYCGNAKYTDEKVIEWMMPAIENDLQILAHCNGDASGDQFLRCYQKACEKAGKEPKDDLRPVMIHCQTMREDQAKLMHDLKMIASVFVGHVFYWGDIHMKNFGPRRGNNISPCRWALDHDLVINLHQDMPVTRPNMLHSIWCAVNRISRTGALIGEEQKISVYEAFRAASYGGAYAYYEEDEKGTLEPGKKADMIILDQNPFEIDPMEIKDIHVLETIKDDVTLYKR